MTFDLEVIFQLIFFITSYTTYIIKIGWMQHFQSWFTSQVKGAQIRDTESVQWSRYRALHGLSQVHQEDTETDRGNPLQVFSISSNKAHGPSPRCVKSLLKFSLILKGDLLTCIAMVQCDLDTTVRLFCPPSQSLISTYNWERKRMIVFCLQVPGHSDRIDKLWNQLRQQLLNNSEDI